MQLITKELADRFDEVGSQVNVDNPIIIAKFFNPIRAGTWYATEYYPEERVIFRYASIFGDWNDEWGYTSIDELEGLKLPFDLGIVKAIYWVEKPFSEVMQGKAIKN